MTKKNATHIRLASIEDVPEVTQLLALLFTQEAEFLPDSELQQRGITEVILHPERGCFFVIEQSNHVLGVVALHFLTSTALGGKVALLEDMIIHPQRRGQGFGKALLTYAIEFAKSQACLRITLLTDADNLSAQAFYRGMGFQPSSMHAMRLLL